MKKIFVAGCVFIFSLNIAHGTPVDFAGEWAYDRDDTGAGGQMQITDCTVNSCAVEFVTYNGAHTCDLDKTIFNITGNIATAEISNDYFDGICKITITRQSNGTLDVTDNGECRELCGMSGYFSGIWQNKATPRLYVAGFDCGHAATDVENAICHHRELARMDVEMSILYKQASGQKSAQKKWIADRNKCGPDTACLIDKYTSRIRELVSLISNDAFNLFNYAHAVTDDGWFHPNDAILIERFIRRAIGDARYEDFTACSNRRSKDVFDKNNIFVGYGCPGMFTIMESAIYMDKKQLWISYLDDGKIKVYAPQGMTEKSMPELLSDWMQDLEKRVGNGIETEFIEYNP